MHDIGDSETEHIEQLIGRRRLTEAVDTDHRTVQADDALRADYVALVRRHRTGEVSKEELPRDMLTALCLQDDLSMELGSKQLAAHQAAKAGSSCSSSSW